MRDQIENKVNYGALEEAKESPPSNTTYQDLPRELRLITAQFLVSNPAYVSLPPEEQEKVIKNFLKDPKNFDLKFEHQEHECLKIAEPAFVIPITPALWCFDNECGCVGCCCLTVAMPVGVALGMIGLFADCVRYGCQTYQAKNEQKAFESLFGPPPPIQQKPK